MNGNVTLTPNRFRSNVRGFHGTFLSKKSSPNFQKLFWHKNTEKRNIDRRDSRHVLAGCQSFVIRHSASSSTYYNSRIEWHLLTEINLRWSDDNRPQMAPHHTKK